MTDQAKRVQRTYLFLTLLSTLAASLIWGVNTLFLLDAGLGNTGAFTANAFFTLGQVIFEVPTGAVADVWGRRTSYLLGAATLLLSTFLYLAMWRGAAPLWGCTARGATPPASASEGPSAGAADTDPNNDEIVAPPDVIDGCEQALEQAKVAYRPATLPLRTQRSGAQCGAPQVVIYERGPAGIRYYNPPLLTCGMALALSRFERVIQEEAERIFGLRVTRIRQMGTYACRKMVRFRMVSEHSYANAIDLEKFVLADRRVISVKEHYGGAQTDTAESRFLRTIARRAYDDGIFSVALGPPWDKLHSNHLHFDLARYRVEGTRW